MGRIGITWRVARRRRRRRTSPRCCCGDGVSGRSCALATGTSASSCAEPAPAPTSSSPHFPSPYQFSDTTLASRAAPDTPACRRSGGGCPCPLRTPRWHCSSTDRSEIEQRVRQWTAVTFSIDRTIGAPSRVRFDTGPFAPLSVCYLKLRPPLASPPQRLLNKR